LHRQALDQSTDREVLLEAPDWEWVSSVTPDGEAVVYSDRTPDGEWSIWMLSIADGEARPLIQEPGFVAKDADVSPDGEWFAYWSDRSGKPEVYLERFPEGGGRVQLSSDGGRHPRWAPDGTRIYYTETTRRMMVVDVVLGDSAVPSRPQFLFEGRYATEAERNYDVHPDGDQLLMLRSADPDADQLRLHVVLNWFDILNDLAPIGLE
jgi:dipeptidyl aminopeptidase/acylaminoacyl peptidase